MMLQPMRDAVAAHERQYQSFGDYSATDLISPMRMIALRKRHGGRTGFMESVASFVGSGVHNYVELMLKQANNPDYELERAVYMQINDRYISGRFDILYKLRHVYDVKCCKTWKTIFDPDMEEWHQQQNIYAYILKQRGIDVDTINIIAIYLDWIESTALRDPSYPRYPVIEYKLDLWPEEQQLGYITDRIELHKACENVADDQLPTCTPEERWERFPNGEIHQFALMKDKHAKRAKKVEATMEDILEYSATAKGLTGESFIEIRHAMPKRCVKYCPVKDHCSWYADYLTRVNSDNLNEIVPLTEVL